MRPRIQPSSAHVGELSGSALESFVGRQIRLRRMLVGLTQVQLATLLGVSFQHVHQFERGYHLNASRLYTISRALSIPVGMLFPDGSAPHAAYDPDTGGARVDLGLKDDGRAQPEVRVILKVFQRLTSAADRQKLLTWVNDLCRDPSVPAPALSKEKHK